MSFAGIIQKVVIGKSTNNEESSSGIFRDM